MGVEAPWSSGQSLKASTSRSGVRIPDNAISTGGDLGFNSRSIVDCNIVYYHC